MKNITLFLIASGALTWTYSANAIAANQQAFLSIGSKDSARIYETLSASAVFLTSDSEAIRPGLYIDQTLSPDQEGFKNSIVYFMTSDEAFKIVCTANVSIQSGDSDSESCSVYIDPSKAKENMTSISQEADTGATLVNFMGADDVKTLSQRALANSPILTTLYDKIQVVLQNGTSKSYPKFTISCRMMAPIACTSKLFSTITSIY